jgi:cytoplasmic iron level regulating protein YaaA (DUF328/UPF0246 family)
MLKFILSPTKTMKPSRTPATQIPRFDRSVSAFKKTLQTMTVKQLKDHFKLSDKLSLSLYDSMHPWQEHHRAIEAYQGQQFKALDVLSLAEDAQAYLEDRLMILSGLYGPLKPNDRIALYRLPLDEGLPGTALVPFWQDRLDDLFKDDLWINAASAEYAQMVPKTVRRIDVDFVVLKGNTPTRPSMMLKTMRGLLIRYAALQKVQSLEELKHFQAQGFTYHYNDDKTLQFIKKDSVE